MRSALLPELRSALCALLLNFLLLSPESSLGAAFSSLRAPCFRAAEAWSHLVHYWSSLEDSAVDLGAVLNSIVEQS
jgi:hypothetical protein